MEREVQQIHEFEQNRKFDQRKEKTVVRCDDGAVYEFEKTEGMARDSPPRLVRSYDPDDSLPNVSRKVLPNAVEDTVETLLGGWSK